MSLAAGVEISGPQATMREAPAPAAIGEYRMTAKVLHWLTVLLIMFMVSSGVIAKQLGEGPVCDLLFGLHKLTGALTLIVIALRLGHRLFRSLPQNRGRSSSRPVLHWTLYGVVMLVPLLGWAGISDFGAREVFPGYSLPPIWPEGAGYDILLLQWHAYFAFGLLALVALHIGVAIQDYMTGVRRSPDHAGGELGAGRSLD
jgi:cytochrome b561